MQQTDTIVEWPQEQEEGRVKMQTDGAEIARDHQNLHSEDVSPLVDRYGNVPQKGSKTGCLLPPNWMRAEEGRGQAENFSAP